MKNTKNATKQDQPKEEAGTAASQQETSSTQTSPEKRARENRGNQGRKPS